MEIARSFLARGISEWLGVQPPLNRGASLPQQERDELTASLDGLGIGALLASEFDSLSEREVLKIERLVRAGLPADHRWFLRNYGAAAASHGIWQIVSAGQRIEVRHFYGRQVTPPSHDFPVPSLMFHLDCPVDFLEDGELPIAETWEGQLTLNAHTGDVSHLSKIDPPVRGLASSFTELINKLEPYVYDD